MKEEKMKVLKWDNVTLGAFHALNKHFTTASSQASSMGLFTHKSTTKKNYDVGN